MDNIVFEYMSELEGYLARKLFHLKLEVDDVVQETYLRYFRIPENRLIENPRAYLYKIATNIIYEYNVKRDKRPESICLDDVDEPGMEITELDRLEQASLLNYITDGLPRMQLKVLVMVKRDGKNYAEIAEELGLTHSTVRQYAFTAIMHCREMEKLYKEQMKFLERKRA